MSSIIAWFTKNPVASSLLMAFLVIGGTLSAFVVKVELFPEFSLEMVRVAVPYPGAAPEEVEEGICVPIEEEVHSIEGVKKVIATAVEGAGTVMIEVRSGADLRRVLDDVKTRVDAIDNFPEEAEEPIIEEVLLRRQVINVAIFGNADERTLKETADRIRDEVNQIEGISQVELSNVRDYEISIEVSEAGLRRYGLTFSEVADAVRNSSLDLSGGSIRTDGGEILVRTKGKAYTGVEFDSVVVRMENDGSRVLLSDVARVVDGFIDADLEARFNGQPVAVVQVFRVGDESAISVSKVVHAYIEKTRPTLPEGIHIQPWQDQNVLLEGRLNLLLKNGLQGLALVFLVLALFLKFRLSFWVTLGIPISFLGAILLMPGLDLSVNMLSLFAFILVLGIVVDDAIVVGESIFREQEEGGDLIEGAVRGVQSVSVPVIFAVLTTVTAFIPMMFLPGLMGKFFAVIPLAVIPALGFSLVESQLILPSHLSHQSEALTRLSERAPFRWWIALQNRFSNRLVWFANTVYRPSLELALTWRYATLGLAIAVLALTVGLVAGGYVRFTFFPDIEGDIIAAELTMPQGTSVKTTAKAVRQIERAAEELQEQLSAEGHGEVVVNFMATVGEQPILAQKQNRGGNQGGTLGTHLAEVVIELVPSEEREIQSLEIADRWRALCGGVAGAVELSFDSSMMGAGEPIDIELSGTDVEELRAAANDLKGTLTSIEGVRDVTDSFRGGKQELVLDIRPEAEALGLTRMDLARQVRQAFYGEEAQRIQRGRDEIKVMVRFPEEDRRSVFGLEGMRIRTPDGGDVPFSAVANVRNERGYATIQRTDRRRTIHVKADVDTAATTANEVLASVRENTMPLIQQDYPGIGYSFEGQNSEQNDTIFSMIRSYALALFVMFALMAIPFRSYLQPLIVMSAIPFGLVGAIMGHLIMGLDMSMLSVLGLAALAGVVVNDSLVLVDYVNRQRAAGLSVVEAARAAGLRRFRPILLTSMTTFAGLTPMILERSVQAKFMIPMAVSLAFGVVFSTFITLVLVPACYLMLDDLHRFRAWVLSSPFKSEDADPAEAT